MCSDCYEENLEEYGRVEVTEMMRQIQTLIRAVYQESSAGGNLHIVLDDWNIEDDHVQWCADRPNLTLAESACIAAFSTLSMAERNEVLRMDWFSQTN